MRTSELAFEKYKKVQHDFHRRRGVGGTAGVWGTTKQGGKRRVVDNDVELEITAHAKGVRETETRWTW